MSCQKKLLCISFNINQSLLKVLHVGIHDETSDWRGIREAPLQPFRRGLRVARAEDACQPMQPNISTDALVPTSADDYELRNVRRPRLLPALGGAEAMGDAWAELRRK